MKRSKVPLNDARTENQLVLPSPQLRGERPTPSWSPVSSEGFKIRLQTDADAKANLFLFVHNPNVPKNGGTTAVLPPKTYSQE
jgi:hypothetical protein